MTLQSLEKNGGKRLCVHCEESRKGWGGEGGAGGGLWGNYGRGLTYDRYCYRIRRPLPAPHICTSRTKSLRRRHQSDFVAAKRSSYFWGHRRGSGKGLGGESFASTTA